MDFMSAPISRLNFDDMSCDDDTEDERSSSVSSSNNHLRKRLNFDFTDDCDIDGCTDLDGFVEPKLLSSSLIVEEAKQQEKDNSMKAKGRKKRRTEAEVILDEATAANLGNSVSNNHLNTALQLTPTDSGSFSPCRTRSGRVYTAGSSSAVESSAEKKPLSLSEHKNNKNQDCQEPEEAVASPAMDESKPKKSTPSTSAATATVPMRRPTPVFNFPKKSAHCSPVISPSPMPTDSKKQLNLLQKDLPDAELRQRSGSGTSLSSIDEPAQPPPLNQNKRPVSRILARLHHNYDHDDGGASGSWKLSDPLGGPASPPTEKVKALKLIDQSPSQISSPKTAPRFGLKSRLFTETAPRRVSAPQPVLDHSAANAGDMVAKKRKRTANINPFTPTPLIVSLKKKSVTDAMKAG